MTKVKEITFRHRSNCPISFSLDIFGDKWTLLVLRDIMFYDRTRYSDFMPSERIATNILADRLAKLEAAAIITKKRDPKLKNQYIYEVTDKGRALTPLLIEMTLWGLVNDPESLASTEFIQRSQMEKSVVVQEIADAIEHGEFVSYRSHEMGINPIQFNT